MLDIFENLILVWIFRQSIFSFFILNPSYFLKYYKVVCSSDPDFSFNKILYAQLTFTWLMSALETLEKRVKYVQS